MLADGGQLTQALLNLMINALQAVENRGRISVRASLVAEDSVELEVQDTGPGVPPDKLIALFEPYFTTKEEGSGLGLWIAQQIAVAHGGRLEAANAVTGGAIFRLRPTATTWSPRTAMASVREKCESTVRTLALVMTKSAGVTLLPARAGNPVANIAPSKTFRPNEAANKRMTRS